MAVYRVFGPLPMQNVDMVIPSPADAHFSINRPAQSHAHTIGTKSSQCHHPFVTNVPAMNTTRRTATPWNTYFAVAGPGIKLRLRRGRFGTRAVGADRDRSEWRRLPSGLTVQILQHWKDCHS